MVGGIEHVGVDQEAGVVGVLGADEQVGDPDSGGADRSQAARQRAGDNRAPYGRATTGAAMRTAAQCATTNDTEDAASEHTQRMQRIKRLRAGGMGLGTAKVVHVGRPITARAP